MKCIRIETKTEIVFSLWKETSKNNEYAIAKVFDNVKFGMVGTELNRNFKEIDITRDIFKKFPEARKGIVNFNVITIKKSD